MSRDWTNIDSAEALLLLRQNRAFIADGDEDLFFAAALLLADMGEQLEINCLHNPDIESSDEDRFIWARTQVVAEGLIFSPKQFGPPIILLDGKRYNAFIDQAIFLFEYYSDWFWELAEGNKSGGAVIVRELREYAELSLRISAALKAQITRDHE